MSDFPFDITDDPRDLHNDFGILPSMAYELDKSYITGRSGKASAKKFIEKMIEKYPNYPQFRNHLSAWYAVNKNYKKAFEINKSTVEKFPNYLFGRITLAGDYFEEGMYEKVPELLGEELKIEKLCPERKIFHFSEVSHYLFHCVKYYAAIGKFEKALEVSKQLNEYFPYEEVTEIATKYLGAKFFNQISEHIAEDEKNSIRVEMQSLPEDTKFKAAPKFHHPEIHQLYEYGLDISDETLNTILSLPRETLIKDLELVLQDSIDRYRYFEALYDKNGWDENLYNFLIHAIYLLGEIRATESLEAVFKVFAQNYKFIEFYIGDFITECMWEPVYKMGQNQTHKIVAFLCRPGVYTYSKSEVAEVLEQIALHQPERKEEVINCFRSVFQFYANSKIEDNVIDSSLCGLLICSVLHIKASELLPEIKRLYDLGYVSESICGSYADVEQSFAIESPRTYFNEILSITDRYNDIAAGWINSGGETTGYEDGDAGYYPNTQPLVKAPKVGRNDPCPCGSGMKFKKCCLK